MGIKRGVSLYSYQQAQFFKKMDWKDMIREVHDHLKTDGIEIIDEATIRDYPFPSEQFIYDFREYMARYNMKAVTMDIYLDVHQFRDHIMNYREAAERLKNDIRLEQPKHGMASALDFRMAEQILELADKTGSKHVGLVPDFGIFQHSPSQVAIDYSKRHAKNPEVIDWILENYKDYSLDEMPVVLNDKFPGHGIDP